MSKLSERIRPGSEAAPWIIDEVRALESERDALRRAAEIGLEYAKGDLAQRKESFAGYPTCWIEEQRDVSFIESALRGEVQGE